MITAKKCFIIALLIPPGAPSASKTSTARKNFFEAGWWKNFNSELDRSTAAESQDLCRLVLPKIRTLSSAHQATEGSRNTTKSSYATSRENSRIETASMVTFGNRTIA